MGYIIDFSAVEKLVTMPDSKEVEKTVEFFTSEKGESTKRTVEHEHPKSVQINTVKYDLFVNLLAVILNEPMEDIDLTLGIDHGLAKAPLPVQIAFNTFEHYGILKEI